MSTFKSRAAAYTPQITVDPELLEQCRDGAIEDVWQTINRTIRACGALSTAPNQRPQDHAAQLPQLLQIAAQLHLLIGQVEAMAEISEDCPICTRACQEPDAGHCACLAELAS